MGNATATAAKAKNLKRLIVVVLVVRPMTSHGPDAPALRAPSVGHKIRPMTIDRGKAIFFFAEVD